MREFKKRRTVGAEMLRISAGIVGVVLVGGVAVAATRATWGMYGKFAEAAAARASAEAQLEDLQTRQGRIAADVEALSSERGLEAEVRERYGVAKPGEGQITIVRPASSTQVVRREPGFLEGLWRLLFVW